MNNKTMISGVTIGIVALGIAIPISVFAADVPPFINIIVKDKDGNPIQGVNCEIVGLDSAILPSDQAGFASGPAGIDPEPGKYVLKCTSDNYNGSTFITIPKKGDIFVEITLGQTKQGSS